MSKDGIQFDTAKAQIILQCAPVLSGLKTSNFVSINSRQWKKSDIENKEVSIYILADNGLKMAVLLYREAALDAFLSDKRVCDMLNGMGYRKDGLMEKLNCFSERYRAYLDGYGRFPHEMGLFLGYPPEDVEGFIKNKGKNFLCSGYWKVYDNMPEKIELFRQFRQAEERMLKLAMDYPTASFPGRY